jgi:myo-inositol 2-dehydrogenase / D-chiro-inositol 1-dehydrogenase
VRIKALAVEMGYTPNAVVRSLKAQQSGTIGAGPVAGPAGRRSHALIHTGRTGKHGDRNRRILVAQAHYLKRRYQGDEMSTKVNVGIIGAGKMGTLHAQHLATRIPGARVVAIADTWKAAAEHAASELDIPEVYGEPEPVLEHPEIDAVLICSNTDTHADLIVQAAAAGKHIFCEKPVDLDIERVDQALEAVEAAGVKLMVGFNRRFDHNSGRLRELVRSGVVGAPHLLHIISRDPAPPPMAYLKTSGGIFLDMTIHDFDMARFLIGSEIEEVCVYGGVRISPAVAEVGDIDTAVVMLSFADGTLGTIDNSRQAVYGYDQRAEVFGSGGCIRSDNDFPNTAVVSDARGIHTDRPLNFFMDRYIGSYLAELDAFIKCIATDSLPPVSGWDGRQALLLGLASWRSYREHRPVRLTEVAP